MASERLQAALEVAGAANAFGFALEAVLGMAELLRLQDHRADGALLVAFVEQCPLAPAALSAEAGRALESSGWSLDQGALADLRRSAAELSPPEAFSLAGAVRVPVQTLK